MNQQYISHYCEGEELREREGGNPILKIPIIMLIAWPIVLGLAPGAVQAQATAATLTKALRDYCIPANASGCEPLHRATYAPPGVSGNSCKCECADMYYDADSGKCEYCEQGTGSNRYATHCGPTSCGAGYELITVAATTSCGAGYEAVEVPYNCATGFGPTSCGAGYELITI